MPNKFLFGAMFLILNFFTPTINAQHDNITIESILDKSKTSSYFKTNIKANNLHDVECLAFMIYGESRGESYKGQLAVAFVVHNRTKKHDKSYCAIIQQSGQFHFNTPFPKRDEDMKKWKDILNLSFRLISEDGFSNIASPIDGAIYFRNNSGSNFSNKKFVKTIGNHHFYK